MKLYRLQHKIQMYNIQLQSHSILIWNDGWKILQTHKFSAKTFLRWKSHTCQNGSSKIQIPMTLCVNVLLCLFVCLWIGFHERNILSMHSMHHSLLCAEQIFLKRKLSCINKRFYVCNKLCMWVCVCVKLIYTILWYINFVLIHFLFGF